MRLTLAFVILWLGLILESTLFQIPPINIIHPGFVLVTLVLIALMRGPNTAVLFGIAIGLIQDVCFGTFIGLNAFCYGVIAYFAGALFSQFLHRNLAITFLTSMLFSFIHTWLTYGLTRLFDVTAERWPYVLSQSLVAMIINGILTLMLYPLLTKLFTPRQRSRYDASQTEG